MRLLNCESLKLEYFADWYLTPPYVILSHVWGEDEVTFNDINETAQDRDIRELRGILETLLPVDVDPDATLVEPAPFPHLRYAVKMKGWSKIMGCVEQARKFGVGYVWCDTCCIDKTSSSELSEAINSMWAWYRDAKFCVAYLEDIDPDSEEVSLYTGQGAYHNELDTDFKVFESKYDNAPYGKATSRWFDRGWTLQELIAPKEVIFFQSNWTLVGTRTALSRNLAKLTLIPEEIFIKRSDLDLSVHCAAQKFSWASRRRVTREEDQAYSLLGLMGITMPIIYGEGLQSAFYRLQLEIFRATADQSLFSWKELRPPDESTDDPDFGKREFDPTPEEFDEMCTQRKATWDSFFSGKVSLLEDPQPFIQNSLFCPSILYFADSHDTVRQTVGMALADTDTVVSIQHGSPFAHATLLRLPLIFRRKNSWLCEYSALLMCGPRDNKAQVYTLKVVLQTEPAGVPWRVLPDHLATFDLVSNNAHGGEIKFHDLHLPPPASNAATATTRTFLRERGIVQPLIISWGSLQSANFLLVPKGLFHPGNKRIRGVTWDQSATGELRAATDHKKAGNIRLGHRWSVKFDLIESDTSDGYQKVMVGVFVADKAWKQSIVVDVNVVDGSVDTTKMMGRLDDPTVWPPRTERSALSMVPLRHGRLLAINVDLLKSELVEGAYDTFRAVVKISAVLLGANTGIPKEEVKPTAKREMVRVRLVTKEDVEKYSGVAPMKKMPMSISPMKKSTSPLHEAQEEMKETKAAEENEPSIKEEQKIPPRNTKPKGHKQRLWDCLPRRSRASGV